VTACSQGWISRRTFLSSAAGTGLIMAFPLVDQAEAAERGGGDTRRLLRVHAREQWDARPPRQRAQILNRPPNRIVIHHTATANTKDYSLEHAYRLSRLLQRFHMERNGWDDIGEQLTISRGGHVMEGRNHTLAAIKSGRHVVGAQVRGHNHHTIGIESEGTYSNAPIPVPLWYSLVDTCVWLCHAYDLNPFLAIRGHRDFNATECPGDVLYAALPYLRKEVARRLRRLNKWLPAHGTRPIRPNIKVPAFPKPPPPPKPPKIPIVGRTKNRTGR